MTESEGTPCNYRDIPTVEATPENIADYGVMFGERAHKAGLPIPFYKGSVEEGANLDFQYRGRAVVRMARIHHRAPEIILLERHMHMTQLFVGLGAAPYAMVLGKPNHDSGADKPDLDNVVAFRMPPGHGVMIHAGTWHDFPMAIDESVMVLTMNSSEVVETLAATPEPMELNDGDVYKIDVRARTGTVPKVSF